jgi:DNA helicase HerA-like ATPase
MTDKATEIGTVIKVTGSKVTGLLAGEIAAEEAANPGRKVRLGEMVVMRTGRTLAFGLISQLSIPNPSTPLSPADSRLMEVDLMGEAHDPEGQGRFSFQRGVSSHPSLGEPIYTAGQDHLALIYAKPEKSYVKIGTIHQDRSLPAYVTTDELIGNHFAVLGTSGSGKSCAVAVILRAILEAHPNGHILLLDAHEEYPRAFGDKAELVTVHDFNLPYWLLNFEELAPALCSVEKAERAVETAILREAVIAAKRDFAGVGPLSQTNLTADTPVPYRLDRLLEILKLARGRLDKPETTLPYQRLLTRIQALRRDRRYSFLFSDKGTGDNMAEVLSRLFRIPVGGRPLTIFSLAGVPSEIIDAVVSVLCRMVFDFALWSNSNGQVPILLVCEEAHRYIPRDSDSLFGPSRAAVSRIAKEGRKYGVSLGLVSQRPSEVSESVLSQCNTLFALRMSNDQDQRSIQAALPEQAAGLINALPALRSQEAVVVGEGVSLPTRIRFNDLSHAERPRSETARVSQTWQEDRLGKDFVTQAVERWRRQSGLIQ